MLARQVFHQPRMNLLLLFVMANFKCALRNAQIAFKNTISKCVLMTVFPDKIIVESTD
jgi:hypothetical protein